MQLPLSASVDSTEMVLSFHQVEMSLLLFQLKTQLLCFQFYFWTSLWIRSYQISDYCYVFVYFDLLWSFLLQAPRPRLKGLGFWTKKGAPIRNIYKYFFITYIDMLFLVQWWGEKIPLFLPLSKSYPNTFFLMVFLLRNDFNVRT